MFIKSGLFRFVLVFCFVFSLAVFAFGDTIRLKSGSIIKGKIVSFDGGTFTVVFSDGVKERRMEIRADEVESIIFENYTAPAVGVKTSNNIPDNNPSVKTTTEGSTKVITVGQKRNNDPPIRTIPDNKPTTSTNIQPITLNVSVLADDTANGWTNSGWVVRKGQRIRISGKGRISLGNGRYARPRGLATLPDENKLIKEKPTGGLIAVIGDDNNDFIYVGDSLEFTAKRDGHLFLGVNEGNLSDNSGSFDVKIEIDPASGR